MARQEWQFFRGLPRADHGLAWAWWAILVLRGLLPAFFAIAMGVLVGAVERGAGLGGPLAITAVIFVLLQVLSPVHQAVGANLGSRTAAWLYDELTSAAVAPPGIGHLENPKLANDLTVARDFDLGVTAPPLSISMDFIAMELVSMVAGLASAVILFDYAWWAPLVLAGAWLATHWLLRESGVWRDRETPDVREAQRHADYTYRLAVGPPAAKELRLFGLADWTLDRFRARRNRLFELRWAATRLRERPMLWSLLLVLAANVLVFAAMASDAAAGVLPLDRLVVFAVAAVTTSRIAFGGLSWALDSASAPVAAVLRLGPSMAESGRLAQHAPPHPDPLPHAGAWERVPSATPDPPSPRSQSTGAVGKAAPRAGVSPAGRPAREIRFRDVSFAYPSAAEPVLERLDLVIPAGSSLAIVGRNGAGKTTLAKLLCRLYDPQGGAIEVDGVDIRAFDVDAWRRRVTAVFQDFIRYHLSLRDNVAPSGAPDDVVRAALEQAGASRLADLDTILARGYAGGTDLSGGQWQRIALARALCAVKLGAGIVLLDEPTAQLDVRGEAEIFGRILDATKRVTTILISHRFSTVRHADRVCVLEHGRVIEIGSHDELIARGGRYRTMYQLQASRFTAVADLEVDEEGQPLDVLE